MGVINSVFGEVLKRFGYTKQPGMVDIPVGAPAFSYGKSGAYLDHFKGWVYGIVKRRSEQFAGVEIQLMKMEKDGSFTEEFDHPSVKLLDKVNSVMTKRDLFEITHQHLDLAGEGMWHVDRGLSGRGEPKMIIPLIPSKMKLIPGKKRLIDGWVYTLSTDQGAKEVPLKPEEVVFFKEPHPTNMLRGMSAVEASAMTIDNDDDAERWQWNSFRHGTSAKPVFQTEQSLDKETLQRLYTQLEKNWSGVEHANKPMILFSGLKTSSVGFSPRDMEFLEGQKWTRDKMMALIGITKTILGVTEDVNRANAETNEYVFSKYMVAPRMAKFVDYLNEFYLPMFKNTENLFFHANTVIPSNTKEKVEMYNKGLAGASWLTQNEVREMEGLEPIEGGDVLSVPNTQTPEEDPKAPKNPLKILNSRHRKLYSRQKNYDKLEEDIQKRLETALEPMISSLYSKDQATFRERAIAEGGYLAKYLQSASTFEQKFKKLMQDHFSKQENGVLMLVQTMFSKRAKSVDRFIPDLALTGEATKKGLSPLLQILIKERGNEALFFIGSNVGINMDNPRARKYIRERSADLVKEIDDTTKDRLRKALEAGVENGEGIPELQKRVKDVFDKAKDSRAEMIARTEVIKASNFASVEAWTESGVVESKEWLTAEDERVEPLCAAMDGKVISLRSSFFKQGDKLTSGTDSMSFEMSVDEPPLHPNCRCTVIPVLIPEKAIKAKVEKIKKSITKKRTKKK